MSFEFQSVEIVPDKEQAGVWENVRRYFDAVLEGHEDRLDYDQESQERVRMILQAIDDNDYSKAFEFLEEEIAEMKLYHELLLTNKTAKDIGTPELFEKDILALEVLRDSLILEEEK